jgi:hypothetical protein
MKSGTPVTTDFGRGVIVEGMPPYPGYVYVSMPNPFSHTGRNAVVPVRAEFVRPA